MVVPNIEESFLYDGSTGSAQKWWFSVLLGFIFAIISSGIPYNIFLKGKTLAYLQLAVQTIIFIIIIRFILN